MDKNDVITIGKNNGVEFSVQAVNICLKLGFDEETILKLIQFYKKGIKELGGKAVLDFIVKGLGE